MFFLVCFMARSPGLQSLDAPSLQDVSLTLDSNQLLAVIGPVGAGKVRDLLVISGGQKAARQSAQVPPPLSACMVRPVVTVELHPGRTAR